MGLLEQLQGYWACDEGGGPPFADSTPHHNDLDQLGFDTPTSGTGILNGCASMFNQDSVSDQSLSVIPGNSCLNPSGAAGFGMTLWFKIDQLSNADGDYVNIPYFVTGGTNPFVAQLTDDGGGMILTLTGTGGASVVSSHLSYNAWHFVGINYKRNGQLKLYIDGSTVGTDANDNTNTDFNGYFYLYGFSPNGYNLSVDEIGCWKRSLSDAEFDTLYGSGTPPGYTSFLGPDTYYTGFSKRKPIIIKTDGIPASNLTAFPKLFMISGDTDIGGETTSQKLAVTLADGVTQVPYGALYWNSSGGSATLKIRAKFDLSSSWSNGDTIGYLYYDHTATDQSNKSGVLDSNCKLYLPFEEDPAGSAPQFTDWTSNGNHGTNNGTGTTSVTGQIGSGVNLNGTTSNYISTAGNVLSGATAFTISLLANLDNTAAFGSDILVVYDDFGSSGDRLQFGLDGNSPAKLIFKKWEAFSSAQATSDSALTSDTWLHLVGRCKADGTLTLFINGAAQSSTGTKSGALNATQQWKFVTHDKSFGHDDSIDELRMDATDRADAWIAYDYTDQFSNSSTFTLGAEEVNSSAVYAPYYYRHLAGSGALCV